MATSKSEYHFLAKNLPAFYHECRFLIGCDTSFVDSDYFRNARLLTNHVKLVAASLRFPSVCEENFRKSFPLANSRFMLEQLDYSLSISMRALTR